MAAPSFKRSPSHTLKLAGLTAWLLILVSITPPPSIGNETARRTPAISTIAFDLNAQSRLAKHGIREPDRATRSRISEAYGKTALSFQANHGQTDKKVKFLARARGYDLFLTRTEAVLTLRIADGTRRNADSLVANYKPPYPQSAYIKMSLVGANPAPDLSGEDPLPGASNYFIGAHGKGWQTDVPAYARVKYSDVYPGVDMIYYGNQRDLEYDFKVAPGANPAVIWVSYEVPRSRSPLRMDENGDLIIEPASVRVRQPKPFAYQEIDGAKKQIEARYVLKGSRVGFSLGPYDKSKPLVIDPVLSYSTYLGANGSDTGLAIAVDSAGNAYIAGETNSSNFPVAFGSAHIGLRGTVDVFVIKLNSSGSLAVYSAFIGGTRGDSGLGIAVDSAGAAYISGVTASKDFSVTTEAFQKQSGGSRTGEGFIGDAFVTKLSPSGSSLVYSTYLGGAGDDKGAGIAVDSEGNAYVAGTTDSFNFPTTAGASQPSQGGSPAYKSATGGSSWSAIKNGLAVNNVKTLAIDPVNHSTIYVGIAPTSSSTGGVFKSIDGGNSWIEVNNGLNVRTVNAIAIDPDTPSTVYVGTNQGVFKSTDGGGSWTARNQGLTFLAVNALAIDPKRPSTIYAGTGFLLGPPAPTVGVEGGIFKSTDGGASWTATAFNERSSDIFVASLAIDPKKSQMLYAGTSEGFFRGLKGGKKWKGPTLIPIQPNFITMAVNSIAIDPNERSTIHVAQGSLSDFAATNSGIFKSTDRGTTWGAPRSGINVAIARAIAVDPRNSSTLYAGGQSSIIPPFGNPPSGALLKSTNGGESWTSTELSDVSINAIAIDPQNSSVYAGAFIGSDAFITKIDPVGSKLIYSTYLGGRGADLAFAIAIDSTDAAYVTGHTVSDRFPLKDAFQISKGRTDSIGDAFVAKLNPAGSALVYSSYLGGNGIDEAFAIGVDSSGAAYVTGRNNSLNFPTVNPLQATLSGSVFDIFITKVSPAESP